MKLSYLLALPGRSRLPIERVVDVMLPEHAYRRNLRRLIAEGKVEWGRHSYGQPTIYEFEDDSTKVVIGNFCSIAKRVSILLGGNHPTDRGTTFPFRIMWGMGGPHDGFPSSKGDIHIGNDVWLGFDVTVVSGVTIGDGCVVAAGAVVSKGLPPYTICGGIPAKPLRQRFSPEITEALLELKWWDLPDEQIRPLVPLMSSDRVEEFVEALRELRAR